MADSEFRWTNSFSNLRCKNWIAYRSVKNRIDCRPVFIYGAYLIAYRPVKIRVDCRPVKIRVECRPVKNRIDCRPVFIYGDYLTLSCP